MKYNSITFWLIFLSLTLFGCIEEIPFKTNTGDGLLVVDGGFSDNEDEPQTITLQKTTAFGTAPEPVKGAKVSVKSLDGKEGVYVEKNDGKYTLEPQILRGIVGQTYFVEIVLSTGQTYQSEPEIMPARVTPDSIFLDFGTETNAVKNTVGIEQKVVNVYVSTPFKVEKKDTYLRWDLYSAFQFETLPECDIISKKVYSCYYSDLMNPQTVRVFSSKELGLDRTNKIRVSYQPIDPGYTFLRKHYFSLYQHVITAKAYDYWQKINIVSNQNGSIFDRIPATIKGNIFNKDNKNEQVLGYFQISSVAIKRIYFIPGDVSKFYPLLPTSEYCDLLQSPDGNFFAGGCCDCMILPHGNATRTRPTWW
jgi:Domain of unknown function (DUF4249)